MRRSHDAWAPHPAPQATHASTQQKNDIGFVRACCFATMLHVANPARAASDLTQTRRRSRPSLAPWHSERGVVGRGLGGEAAVPVLIWDVPPCWQAPAPGGAWQCMLGISSLGALVQQQSPLGRERGSIKPYS